MKLGALPCGTLLLLAGVARWQPAAPPDGLTPTGPSNAGGKDGGRDAEAGPRRGGDRRLRRERRQRSPPSLAWSWRRSRRARPPTTSTPTPISNSGRRSTSPARERPTTRERNCGCLSGIAMPWPARPPTRGGSPSAAVTGSPLAALTPFPFRSDGRVSTGQFPGDVRSRPCLVGLAGRLPGRRQPALESRRCAVAVGRRRRRGRVLHHPRTGALLSSVTPFLARAVHHDRSHARLPRSPGRRIPRRRAPMLLILRRITTNSSTCFCAVPDSVGALTSTKRCSRVTAPTS